MNLTHQQVQALREGKPVPVVLPEVGEECILVRRDVYERAKQTVVTDLPNFRAISGLVEAIATDEDPNSYTARGTK